MVTEVIVLENLKQEVTKTRAAIFSHYQKLIPKPAMYIIETSLLVSAFDGMPPSANRELRQESSRRDMLTLTQGI